MQYFKLFAIVMFFFISCVQLSVKVARIRQSDITLCCDFFSAFLDVKKYSLGNRPKLDLLLTVVFPELLSSKRVKKVLSGPCGLSGLAVISRCVYSI